MDMPIGRVAHTHLPYCLQKTKDGKWLVLNRNYKPLGVTSKEWVDYDNHPDRIAINARTISALRKLAIYDIPDMPDDPGLFFFYNDGSIPTESPANWNRYAKILQLLAGAKTK
ncbi:hypothetical protein [Lysobacter brunescens]|uniref:Uncharacterized protein n=1 Tax=Lysobacter brunescens TaxID=262323 RepID=A0ABW2Y9F2_9GAMM